MGCKYCQLDNGTKLSHLSRCPFNPRNNTLILDWLREQYKNQVTVTGTGYSDFARENQLPVSNTIYKLFTRNNLIKKGDKVTDIFTVIIYRSYLLNPNIDLELLDLYMYQATFGMFGMNTTEYLDKVHKVHEQDGLPPRMWEERYIKFYEDVIKTC